VILLAILLTMSAPPVVTDDGGQVRVTNPGPAKLVGVRLGAHLLHALDPGESATLPATGVTGVVLGRYPPEDWPTALETLRPEESAFHLRTAGYLLDAIDGGPPGMPGRAANIRALRRADPEALAPAARPGEATQLALLARAARHVPAGPLLDRLLAAIPPDAAAPLPQPYDVLGPPSELVRRAIEQQGAAAGSVLARHGSWRRDRGLTDDRLLAALDITPRPAAAGGPAAGSQEAFDALVADLEAGRFDSAAAHALGLAGPGWTQPQASSICYALELSAGRDIAAGRWLAAEAQLNLASATCADTRGVRARTADLWRARGDDALARADVLGAVGWYRGAWMWAHDGRDKARLADTLADLARLQYAAELYPQGDRWLEEARDVDAFRKAVLEVGEARPRVDPRARVGLMIICVFLGVFALRRLRRVIRSPKNT
jgi:hypothetical protein